MPTAELGLFVEMMQVGPVQFGRQLFGVKMSILLVDRGVRDLRSRDKQHDLADPVKSARCVE
jgi:hypothetical protein